MNSKSNGECRCGCGQKTKIAPKTQSDRGWVKGEPMPFIFGHQNKGKRGSEVGNWKGGRNVNSNGYVRVRMPDHPRSNNGYVLEHILVAEQQLGRYIPDGYDVHHKNGNRSDNRPENLTVCDSRGIHFLLHKQKTAIEATGDPNKRKCMYCKKWDDAANLYTNTQGRTLHKWCKAEYDKRRNSRHALS